MWHWFLRSALVQSLWQKVKSLVAQVLATRKRHIQNPHAKAFEARIIRTIVFAFAGVGLAAMCRKLPAEFQVVCGAAIKLVNVLSGN